MMMQAVYSSKTKAHRPKEILWGKMIDAFESPERLEVVLAELSKYPDLYRIVDTDCDYGRDCLAAVHDAQYVTYLETIYAEWVKVGGNPEGVIPECFPHARMHNVLRNTKTPPKNALALPGYYSFDLSACVMDKTWEAAYWSVQVAVHACEVLLSPENQRKPVLALCRPPGHHCERDIGGGYCVLNNAAVAVQRLVDKKHRVAILDVDYHHGNGTQAIFYTKANPLYVSLHGDPAHAYPYFAGFEDETGEGEGAGFNLNIPLPMLTQGEDYLAALSIGLKKIEEYKADVLVVSLGLDTYKDDQLGDFELDTPHYAQMGTAIGSLGLPSLIIFEGGYHLETLGSNISAVCQNILKIQTKINNAN
eukprot:TRINITY_DN1295_c0_g1_i1.p1 TRINITY_DN1295_c0_g1~~TRINITY_DN1295_c0_g1_i1.p1  ORF type:complete len:363 (-),score=79.47 TRINITY_DN1295_c0_g1_i1:5-1093(-)